MNWVDVLLGVGIVKEGAAPVGARAIGLAAAIYITLGLERYMLVRNSMIDILAPGGDFF